MKNKSQFLLVILIVLIIVVLGALKGIESKIDSIEEKMSDQGSKITALYDYVDEQIGLKEHVEKKQEDTSLFLTPRCLCIEPSEQFRVMLRTDVNNHRYNERFVES